MKHRMIMVNVLYFSCLKIRFVSRNSNVMNTRFVPFMSQFKSFIVFLLVSGSLLSCSRNDDQVKFEKEAYSSPSGYTETTSQAAIVSEDPDDWRISPLFQGLVQFNGPPFPNPAPTNQLINFEIHAVSGQPINGLYVVTRNDDGTLKSPPLYERFETINSLTTFTINPIEFGFQGSPEGARGLHRVFIFDGNQQMISYGDIMVE